MFYGKIIRERLASRRMILTTADLITGYNYDEFVPAKFGPWLRFDQSPLLGEKGPDFPLTRLDSSETYLSDYSSRAAWDLITRNTQAVTSGIYLYTIDSPIGTQAGKIVIVK